LFGWRKNYLVFFSFKTMLGKSIFRASRHVDRAIAFRVTTRSFFKFIFRNPAKDVNVELQDGRIGNIRIKSQAELENLLDRSGAMGFIDNDGQDLPNALITELKDLKSSPLYQLAYGHDESEIGDINDDAKEIIFILRGKHSGRLNVETQEELEKLLERAGAVALIEGKEKDGPFVLKTQLKELTSGQVYYFSYSYDGAIHLEDGSNISVGGEKTEVEYETLNFESDDNLFYEEEVEYPKKKATVKATKKAAGRADPNREESKEASPKKQTTKKVSKKQTTKVDSKKEIA